MTSRKDDALVNSQQKRRPLSAWSLQQQQTSQWQKKIAKTPHASCADLDEAAGGSDKKDAVVNTDEADTGMHAAKSFQVAASQPSRGKDIQRVLDYVATLERPDRDTDHPASLQCNDSGAAGNKQPRHTRLASRGQDPQRVADFAARLEGHRHQEVGGKKALHSHQGGDVSAHPPRRHCSQTVALEEIERFQESTGLLLRKRPFQKLVREIAVGDLKKPEARFRRTAVLAQQEVLESELTETFEASNMCALHDRRVIIMPKDVQLARKLSKRDIGSGL